MWTRGWFAALGIATLGLVPASRGQEERPAPVFPSGVEIITVDAVVLDERGRPVRGLGRDDFVLFEDGQLQPIASFEAFDGASGGEVQAPAPGPIAVPQVSSGGGERTFVLAVDDLSLAPTRQERARSALASFIVGLRDGDELIFATTSRDIWWMARLPEGREDLLALAARVRGRSLTDAGSDAISEWEAYRIANVEGASEGGIESAGGANGAPVVGVAQNITERVVQRYMERGVCDPRARTLCLSKVRARAGQVDQRRLNRTRDTLALVDRAVFALTGIRGRKSLLLLTEGFLNDPAVSALQEVAGRCREANLVVYSLDVRGLIAATAGELAESAFVPNTAELGLMRAEAIDFEAAGNAGLAEDTGGFALRNTNDLAGGASRVAEESRVYYLLGFTPPPGKGPRDWRKLRVEVKRPGLKVRARKGYTRRPPADVALGPAPERKTAPADGAPPLPADVARALATAHDLADLPLRAMAHVLEERPGGLARVLVTVEADVRRLANLGGDEVPRAVVSLTIAATQRDSGKTQRLAERLRADTGQGADSERWLSVTRELQLGPGVTQARVVVRDEFLGRVGALTLRFEVPSLSGLRVSTPILTDRLYRLRPAAAPQPALVARREFAREGNLYCQFQVFGAKVSTGGPRVVGSFEVRRLGGEVVRRGDPTPIEPTLDGRLVRFLALPLGGQAEGDYELVLHVLDQSTGETREVVEALRVVGRS